MLWNVSQEMLDTLLGDMTAYEYDREMLRRSENVHDGGTVDLYTPCVCVFLSLLLMSGIASAGELF